MAKNYYIILGIPTDASQNQIKQAYRRRVKELHPDYYGQHSGPFREIQQAYNVLTDPKQRSVYDRKESSRATAHTGSEIIIGTDVTKEAPIEPIEPVKRPPMNRPRKFINIFANGSRKKARKSPMEFKFCTAAA